MSRWIPLLLLNTVALGACRDSPSEPLSDVVVLAQELDVGSLGLSPPPPNSLPVRVGIFLSEQIRSGSAPSVNAAMERTRAIVASTNAILAQCNLHLELETAQILGLPDRLLDIAGNRQGSWGGHPPAGVGDPDLFSYEQNERLTEETRELFSYAKRATSPNAISAFHVRSIEYYIGNVRTAAEGLSFPPNQYHHADDYPQRNSVLLVGHSVEGLFSNVSGRVFAHEIGHMLLNSGSHEPIAENLMARGTALTTPQCERMRANRLHLYGEQSVPDPGPPD